MVRIGNEWPATLPLLFADRRRILPDRLNCQTGSRLFSNGDSRRGILVNDSAGKDGQLALQVFDVTRGHGTEVAIPDHDIGVLTSLNGSDSIFETQMTLQRKREALEKITLI